MINSMWKIDPESLNLYFPEIANHSRKCKVDNCKHMQEMGCAVKLAVKNKNIRKDRYESYLKLLKDLQSAQKQEKNIDQASFRTIEEELQVRFKVRIRENQKSLNIENILVKLSLEEKIECLELLYKLQYIEVLDISKNGEIYLSDKIKDLSNRKKLRIDIQAIKTERDKDLINELKNKGIKVNIYLV